MNETIIQSRIDVDGEAQKRISGMKDSERQEWLTDMRFNLLMMDVENEGLKAVPLKAIVISQYIYVDGLTQDTLFQRLFHVRKGVQLVLHMVGELLKG